MKNNSFDEIRQAFSGAEKIIISAHTSPDGDAIGSSCGLAKALRLAGKDAWVYLEEMPEKYLNIPVEGLYRLPEFQDTDCDLFIALACADKARLGLAEAVFDKAPRTVCIDHHGTNEGYGDLNYVDGDAASASELVYDIIKDAFPIDIDAATLIYAGILYDTGGFRHSSTKPSTMHTAGELMAYGIPFSKVYNRMFYTQNFTQTVATAVTINNAKLLHNGDFVFTYITNDDIKRCGSSSSELDGISEYFKRTAGTKVSVFAKEKENGEVRISMRADGEVNVSKIAASFGGGGHVNAAGCTIKEPLDKACRMITDAVNKALDSED